jgi:hypothetical protein
MADRVAVFCDFNGVVNVPKTMLDGFHIVENVEGLFPVDSEIVSDLTVSGKKYVDTKLEFSSKLVEELNTFASNVPNVWYWLSSWRNALVNVVDDMGLTLPSQVADWLSFQEEGFGFKLSTVKSFMAKNPNMPVIWVDDVAVDMSFPWWEGASNVTPLLVKPDTFTGLSVADLDAMYAYSARHCNVNVAV